MTKEQLVLLTVVELKAMAKENGLKGYSKLRKAELIELLTVEVTFEEVCNKAPEEFHYWNGETEGLSVFESVMSNNEDLEKQTLPQQLETLVKECDYILENVLCDGSNYKTPNGNTLGGELYYEDKTLWHTKVNDIIAYKSYLQYLILHSNKKENAAPKTENDNIKVEGVTGTWYIVSKAIQDNGQPMLLLESEQYGEDIPCLIVDKDYKIILEDVESFEDYLNNSETVEKAQLFTKVYCSIADNVKYNEAYKKFFAQIICADVVTMVLDKSHKVTINNYNNIVNLLKGDNIKTIYHPALNDQSLEEFLGSTEFKKIASLE